VLTTIACLVLAPVNGRLIVLWGFPVLVSNLLLAGRRFGLLANFCLILGLTVTGGLHADIAERVTYVITAALLSLYAYLFAVMTDSQRDKLQSLATFDELTGAGNRRMMQQGCQ
jgi:diguanylate cyclase